LVQSNDGNVITKDAFLEILTVEKVILDDSELSPTLSDGNQSVISVVDTVLAGKQLLDTISTMNETFQAMNYSLMGFSYLLNGFDNSVNQVVGTPLINDTLISINASLSENSSLLANGLSYGDMSVGISSSEMSIDEKIENITDMNDNNITELVSDIVNYDNSNSENLKECGYSLIINTTTSLYAQISAFNNTLNTLLTNPAVYSNTSSYGAVLSMQYILSTLTGTNMQLQYMIQAMDLQNTTTIMDKSLESIATGISFMLTTDFNNVSISADGTLISVQFNATTLPGETSVEKTDRFLAIEMHMQDVLANQNLSATKMSVFGSNIISKEITDVAMDTMGELLPVAFLLVIVILAIIYRNFIDLFISLMALGFSVIWVYGFGVLFNFTFNPMTIAVPILIVGLGIDYGIHVTLRYREEVLAGHNAKESTGLTIRSVGVALLLTTITTLVSFLSNMFSEMSVMAQFGIQVFSWRWL